MGVNRQTRAVAVLLLSSVFWGLSWLPLRYLGQQGLSGSLLICVCYGVMGVMLLPWLWRFRHCIREQPLALLGVFVAGGLANLCFNYALIYGEVVRVMVLFYLLPVWGVLGGRFILHEETNSLRWLGVALAVVGAVIILGGWSLFLSPLNLLDLCALLSGLFFAANNLLFRALEKVPLSLKLSLLFWGCATFALMFAFVEGRVFRFTLTPAAMAMTLFFAGVWLLWTNVGTQWAVTKLAAGRSAILMIMELVAAVFSAILVAGEIITFQVVVGGLLILSATFIEIVQISQPNTQDT